VERRYRYPLMLTENHSSRFTFICDIRLSNAQRESPRHTTYLLSVIILIKILVYV